MWIKKQNLLFNPVVSICFKFVQTLKRMQNNPVICIFDDDEELLELCSVILRKRGFNVYTFDDCTDIKSKVLSVKPNVILMDNWIPDVGGVKATQTLKSDPALKQIPVVFFSANNDVPALATLAGAEEFITKPFNISDLEQTVIKLTEQNP
jgi:CheY-like chemotaxis protein